MTVVQYDPPPGPGHNMPPDPLEEVLCRFGDTITESENWLDGEPVSNKDQMKAVDELAKGMKAARKAVKEARDAATGPLHEAWKAEVAKWKPTEDDLDRIIKGLASIVGDYKKKLADEQAAAKHAAYIEAEAAKAVAERAAREAAAGDIDAQREAAAAKRAALDKAKAAQRTGNEKVTGLRRVQRYAITDYREALRWIAANDRDAVTAFIEDYVSRNHKRTQIGGVSQWEEKEAF